MTCTGTDLRQAGQRLFRVLRPTLHTSTKPQYIRHKDLRARYRPVTGEDEISRAWQGEYSESEKGRTQEKHLLCGAVLPIWNALTTTLAEAATKAGKQLLVRRAEVNGRPIIGSRPKSCPPAVRLETSPGPFVERSCRRLAEQGGGGVAQAPLGRQRRRDHPRPHAHTAPETLPRSLPPPRTPTPHRRRRRRVCIVPRSAAPHPLFALTSLCPHGCVHCARRHTPALAAQSPAPVPAR